MTAKSERVCQSLWMIANTFNFDKSHPTVSELKLCHFYVDYTAVKRRAVPITGLDYITFDRKLQTDEGTIEACIQFLEQEGYVEIDRVTSQKRGEKRVIFTTPVLPKDLSEGDVQLIQSVGESLDDINYTRMYNFLERTTDINFNKNKDLQVH